VCVGVCVWCCGCVGVVLQCVYVVHSLTIHWRTLEVSSLQMRMCNAHTQFYMYIRIHIHAHATHTRTYIHTHTHTHITSHHIPTHVEKSTHPGLRHRDKQGNRRGDTVHTTPSAGFPGSTSTASHSHQSVLRAGLCARCVHSHR
jgi:hypothetical protein